MFVGFALVLVVLIYEQLTNINELFKVFLTYGMLFFQVKDTAMGTQKINNYSVAIN